MTGSNELKINLKSLIVSGLVIVVTMSSSFSTTTGT